MEALYRAVFTNVPDAILVADGESRYLDANPAAIILLGYTHAELLQLRVADVVGNDRDWTAAEYAQFVQDGTWAGELEVRRKDGTLVPVEARATTVVSTTGAVYVSVLRDITLRRQIDATRAELLAREQAARAVAQESLRARDQFLRIAAHELKTPLTSILGNAQLLQRRLVRSSSLTATDMGPLNVIASQANRLNTLIASLFDISQMETGQFSIQRAPLDLTAFVQQIVVAMRPAYPTHVITYVRPLSPLIVDGDAARLEQALQNLIQNAVKYSPDGQSITVRVERCGETACVAVEDQGMGIPQAAMPHLFDRFYRAPNAESQLVAGLGIGLYVVKEIVTYHGGTIAVASQEGQGSTFTITLPLAA
ncbi:MAG TPA: PAS domain-containing sensor histidine kinase [Roseiflexaceae bacterium]|nr:PAS domain-containing sensor histidine kinase [Roseiflexaceae bacterium]